MSQYQHIKRNLILFAVAAILTTPLAMAQALDKGELKKLVETATTSQDHERIAAHFDAKATELEAEAKDHDELAAVYMAHPNGHDQKHPMSGLTAGHCKYFATTAREAAKAARQLAADHRQMAKSVQ